MSASAGLSIPPAWRFVIRWLSILAAAAAALVLCIPGRPALGRAPYWWVHGAFATCVRTRESHDGRDPNANGNLYGIQDAHGGYAWAQGVPRSVQDYMAWQLYLRYGVQPWRPYDGC